MAAAVTARTSEGPGRGRRERIVPVEPIRDVPAMATVDRQWVDWAVRQLHSDAQRSADTHLLRLPTPAGLSVDLYLKDESTHPTGSLKHRLARSLFLYAICSGDIGPGTTVVEASSGSTAISEAYFARLLGLPFAAVMARSTSQGKIALIEREGGCCKFVDGPGEVYAAAQELARREGGHYLDQFTNAERATDWRGSNNIAESIFEQLTGEPHPVPGVGRGGCRYGRYQRGHRTVPALPRLRHQAGGRRPRRLSIPPGLRGKVRANPLVASPQPRTRIADRRHWPAAGGALVPATGDRSDDRRAGCRLGGDDAVSRRAALPASRAVDRYQHVRCPAARLRNARKRCGRQRGHADV